MLEIKGLYKKINEHSMENLNLKLENGSTTTIECSNEISDALVGMILGRLSPGKGEITIAGINNMKYTKKNINSLGVIFREEKLYENMNIEYYLKFFNDILGKAANYKEIMMKLALLDIGDMKIKKLSFSQKRRVSFARELLKKPEFLIFQEPILNVDRESSIIILENIEALSSKGTSILNTSVSFREALLIGGQAYRLNEEGLKEINNTAEDNMSKSEIPPVYKIEKIPAKLEERILLFDPVEIDYIESDQGVSSINVRGEKFVSALSLTELEQRLKYFGFFRCHRSYLVNLQRVREVITWTRNSYSLCLDDKNKSTIPLSKGRIDELKEVFKI